MEWVSAKAYKKDVPKELYLHFLVVIETYDVMITHINDWTNDEYDHGNQENFENHNIEDT